MMLPAVMLSWLRALEARVTAGSIANALAALQENEQHRLADAIFEAGPDPAPWDLSA